MRERLGYPIGLLAAKYWGIPFNDLSPDLPKKRRSQEILAWLKKHPTVKRYAVIDDEDDGLDDLPLFQPLPGKGLTAEIAHGVARFLEGKSDRTMRRNILTRIEQNVRSVFVRGKN